MKTLFVLFLYVLTAMIIIFSTTEAEAQQCQDCLLSSQMAGYCSGKFPPVKDASDDAINANADLINKCVAEQDKYRQSVILLYQKYFIEIPDISVIFQTCTKASYSPHFLDLRLLYNCVEEVIFDKRKM